MTMLVLEKTESTDLRSLFTLFGTEYKATRLFWLHPIIMIVLGILIALVVAPVEDMTAKVLVGIGYGILIMLVLLLHALGHIISSRLVGTPITYIQLSMTVATTHYADTKDHPSYIHIGRALGGPISNLIFGLIFLAMYNSSNNTYLAFGAVMNLLLFVVAISPIPTLDGSVILRELRNWRARQPIAG